MKPTYLLLIVGTLALAACQNGTAPAPSGGAAGDMGPGFCDSPPANPDDLADWNQVCMPERDRGGRR